MISLGAILFSVLITGEPAEPGVSPVRQATDQGIPVVEEDQQRRVIAWFELDAGVLPDGVDPRYASIALDAWRARARLDRGDSAGALPLYESLAEKYLWKQGGQSLDVCDGLASCLISDNQRRRAVEAMLATPVARSGVIGGLLPAPPSWAVQVGLRPDLPPVFEDTDPGQVVDSITAAPREQLLHAYYAFAGDGGGRAGVWLARINELKRSVRGRDPGLVLVEQVSFALAHPEESARSGARDSLRRRTQTQQGGWIEVWARLGLGVSLINDDDAHQRDRGLLELVHIIVRLGDVEPGLTLMAARIAGEYLEQTDRASWGRTLMQEAQNNIQRGSDRDLASGDPQP